MRHILAPVALLAALALAACGKPAADTKPRVLCSNPPTAWLVKQIAGDKVIVQTLTAPGGCGHGYQPTDAEMVEAGKAQIWFQAGLEFEKNTWAKNLPMWKGFLGSNPHSWMTLRKLADNVNVIGPDCEWRLKPSVVPNYAIRESIRALDSALVVRLTPLKGTTFLADHAAYAHFAADYNLKQIAIEEDEHAAVSDAHLTDIIAKAKQAQVKVLFLAEEANRPLAETVAKAVGAKIVAADPNEENTPALLERMADELVKAHAAKP